MKLGDYTITVIKVDRRYREGERRVETRDYEQKDFAWMLEELKILRHRDYPGSRYRLELTETYVTRRNLMTGGEYQERFDTPHSCSPSSETYWSM